LFQKGLIMERWNASLRTDEPNGETPMTPQKAKRVAFYLRVSTDGQTVENQQKELDHLAALEGWINVEVFQDEGISGSLGREARPGFNELLYRAERGHFDVVAAWSLDRLGREPRDVFELTALASKKGFTIYLHKDRIDTGTASGELFFTIMAGMAKFERRRLQERVKAGLKRAKAQGKTLGRPVTVIKDTKERIIELRANGKTVREIATELGVGVGSVARAIRNAG
jgi:DNA invertase Pin-like site-specific DNA recombinase